MNPASFAHPNTGAAAGNDTSNDQSQQLFHHAQLAGLNPYSQLPLNGQQNPLIRQPYQSIMQPPQNHAHGPNFLPRGPMGSHTDFSHLTQQQLNGYPAQYMNGAGSGPHQGPINNGTSGGVIGNASANMSGTGPDWMSLQGLSLQSH